MSNVPFSRPPVSMTHKVILYGAGGTGKTASTVSALIDAPKERRLVYLMTERNSLGGIAFGLSKFGITPKAGQIVYVFPQEKKKAFVDLERSINAFASSSKKAALTGNTTTTEGKENYTYLTKILKALGNFKGTDYVTGEEVLIGNVGDLLPSDVLIVDGLSPIGAELWNTLVGDKILVSQSDYLPVQRALYSVLAQLTKLDCHVILLAHERETFNDSGSLEQVKVNLWCGNSNYETVMGLFTDVVYCYKLGAAYKWAGSKNKVYTVARTIPQKDNLEPSFITHGFFK